MNRCRQLDFFTGWLAITAFPVNSSTRSPVFGINGNVIYRERSTPAIIAGY